MRLAAVVLGGTLLVASCTGGADEGAGGDRGDRSAVSEESPTAEVERCHPATTGPDTHRYAVRDGAPPELTSLDVHRPATCAPLPVVVWVHGGGWQGGDKQGEDVGPKVALAERLGAALVAVNHRLATPGSGVRWPDHSEDLAAALAWLGSEGPTHGLDPSRVVLIGHSAGAHLVSLGVVDLRLRQASGLPSGAPSCVVALDSGGYDLARVEGDLAALVAVAFGTDPSVLADASPLVQVQRNGAPAVDFLVLTRGSPARRAMAARFVDAVAGAGGRATLVDAGDYSHADVNVRLGEPGEARVTSPVTEFLAACLEAPASSR